MVLPVNRVVVGAGFPAEGKADIYDRFTPGDGNVVDNRLVVISLGLRSGDRDLQPFDLAGALAAQIQRVIDEVHREHARVVVDASTSPASTNRLTPAPTVAATMPGVTATPASESPDQPDRMAGASLPRLQELLATVQEGQPLVAAGPDSNSANP